MVSKKEWRLFWTVALVLALVSGGATALTAWLGRPEEPKNVLPSQSPFRADVADTIEKHILITDFDLPAPGGEWLSKTWLYSRDGGNRPWTAEEIQPFWTPVERIPLLSLPQKNEQAIDNLLGSVR
jgi:hypothetical protein